MITLRWLLLSTVISLAACASGPGGGGRYDPIAVETLGTVLERKNTGRTTSQPRNFMLVPAGGLFIPIPTDGGTSPLPVYEHRIALDDGRTVSVFTWYADHKVGGCVKLFESPRSDYPRLINSSGCKPRN